MRKIVICSTAACSHLASRASSSPARVRWVLHSGRLEGKRIPRETAPGLGFPSQIFHAKWHIYRETKPLIFHLPFFESAIHFMHG